MPNPASCGSQFEYAAESHRTLSDRILSELARAGDEAAAWALTGRVEGVIRTAVGEALRNQPRPACLDFEDFVSYARKEVQRAMLTWKAGDGPTFHLAAYAGTVTRRSVQDRLAKFAPIPVDRETRREALAVGKQAGQFEEEHGRAPELGELAAITGKSRKRVQAAMDWQKPTVSLEAMGGSDQDGEKRGRGYEPAADPEEIPDVVLSKKDLLEVLLRNLSELPPRQRIILSKAFGLDGQPDLDRRQLARMLKISMRQVRKEYYQGIATLKARLKK